MGDDIDCGDCDCEGCECGDCDCHCLSNCSCAKCVYLCKWVCLMNTAVIACAVKVAVTVADTQVSHAGIPSVLGLVGTS